ncbi:phage Gp37/Gp68 family protein [Georhizobium profundi]|uniref:Phage Gp37/Gp68 family protein n=1 Tax=Georhizobium profundi TaxID=2341112 RepID=A0A3S9B734_9HYPH|nr:phage Gp37/Gp68 family protein [Georhizobium profundi]AZN72768.1 phage Gp37/Gp68 family protein [Georhizobium profundi]
MADKTAIEWTDATWNPITGCSVVSPGCTNCYAMRLAGTRLRNHPSRAGLTIDSKAGPVWNGEVRFNERALLQPLSWKQPRMIFVCAHGDLFHESVPDAWIDQVFAVMALAPQHTFQVLTKRSDRMRSYVNGPDWKIPILGRLPLERIHLEAAAHMEGDGGVMDALKDRGNVYSLYLDAPWPLPNVWLGVSVEDQKRADERIPDLLATPGAIRWISAEPLLGRIDFCLTSGAMPIADHPWKNGPILQGIDWIVAGGESGPSARPMHPAWALSLRDQCAAADVPFLFKQWGEFRPCTKIELSHACGATKVETIGASAAFLLKVGKKRAGRELDGVIHDAFPEPREVPAL